MMSTEKSFNGIIRINLQENLDNEHWLDLISVIETSVILLIYSVFLLTTYCKIGGFKHLGLQEHCTMWIFWVTEVLYLVLYTW